MPRGKNEGKPTWQSVGRLHNADGINVDTMCPVITMRNHFVSAYQGNPLAPLFSAEGGAGPLPRNSFNTRLTARLKLASRHLSAPVRTELYSAISFRKGGLSALAGGVAVNHLADHGDHKKIESTREYTQQTVEERAEHTVIIARRYAPTGGAHSADDERNKKCAKFN